MLFKPQERLNLILPPLDIVLATLLVILVPCLAVFAEVRLLNMYFGVPGLALGDRRLTFLSAVLVVFHLALLRVPTISGGLQNAIGALKRYAVLSCPWISLPGLDTEWRPGCWIIPEEFKQPLFRYDSQQYIIERILRLLRDDEGEAPRFVYIEGESGRGKTRTIFLLIHALLKDPKLSPLSTRAFLYDMGAGRKTQDLLCRRLGSVDHEQALIFVDNIHRIEPEVLRDITYKLLDTPTRGMERLVILLGQPHEAWRVRPTAEVRLISAARKQSVYLSLGGVPSRYLAEQLERRLGGDLWAKKLHPTATQTATIAQLHFAQAVARNDRTLASVRELFELIEGVPGAQQPDAHDRMTRFVAVIAAVSLYRGNFSSGTFWRACWAASPSRWVRRLLDCVRMRLVLRRMSRCGFTPRQSSPRAQFVFHEAMAEYCKDHLAANRVFSAAFTKAAEWRMVMPEEQHTTIRWLLSCEVHDAATMQEEFERALLSGTLSPMVRCLDRNRDVLESSPVVGYQYALVLDQVGRFAEARSVYSGLDARTAEESSWADRVRLARVEVEHGAEAYATLDDIVQRADDTANVLAAEYWRIHLNGHLGTFRPEELIRLAERFGKAYTSEQFGGAYFLMHTTARIFFDAHRHVYLSGEHVAERLAELEQLPLEAILRRHLPAFRAFSILYREAHLIAHELLPNFVFFDARPELGFWAGKAHESQITPSVLIERAHEAYTRARDEFAVYGNREHLYLQADTLNLEMLLEDADLDSVRLKLIDYEAFIRKAGFTDLMSYPNFYFFRWHMLKYFHWLERGDQSYAPGEVDSHTEAAHDHLVKMKQFDARSENAYGLWRERLFRALLNSLRTAMPDVLMATLASLQTEAAMRGFWRDARLVGSLLQKRRLRPLDIKRMISFYPFVHQ